MNCISGIGHYHIAPTHYMQHISLISSHTRTACNNRFVRPCVHGSSYFVVNLNQPHFDVRRVSNVYHRHSAVFVSGFVCFQFGRNTERETVVITFGVSNFTTNNSSNVFVHVHDNFPFSVSFRCV
ncbi:hypothetical protein [Enterobacter phage vB_EcRAM-01]|nr:hypothetical protein [Enterobacter phage vB_EcRAM-01]